MQPATSGTFRFRDAAGQLFSSSFINRFSYRDASVHITFDPPGRPWLSGLIQATGLKPNFAYQIKLQGRSTKGGDPTGDDATNERIGYLGRWWRSAPTGVNSNDVDYNNHKDTPGYVYSGYLIIDFLVTDAQGNATYYFEGRNSFHVLWRDNQRARGSNDGPLRDVTIPATAGNTAYSDSNPPQTFGLYGEWEPTRALPGTLVMPVGNYKCDFILTEESFHDSSPQGGAWTTAMSAAVDFNIASGGNPLVITSPASAAPNPAGAGQLVQFSVAALGLGVSYQWNFGDGSPAADGSSVSHRYNAPGTYQAGVAIASSDGQQLTGAVSVTVIPGSIDTDGDGFLDVLESAAGTDPNDPNSTPFNGAPAGAPHEFSVSWLSALLSPPSTVLPSSLVGEGPGAGAESTLSTYRVTLNGVLRLPPDFSAAGQRVIADVGDVTMAVVLDSLGRASAANGGVTLRFRGNSGQGRNVLFQLAMNGSSDNSRALVAGMKERSRTLPVILLLGNRFYRKDVAVAYRKRPDNRTVVRKLPAKAALNALVPEHFDF